ncbi:MAG TPA: 50S ribosomal protein L9 [Candidatus Krumholzibacteria bacterium]|nr:50S ribosomal protein L9 [Candidatus Krumholzibacteria bacterium]
MQIILLHDVDKVGRRGETVNVANGYARNYLFPEGLAVRADTAKKKELEIRLAAFEARDDRDRKSAEELAESMKDVAVKISAAASDEDKLYGSVTAQMIASALVEKGHTVEAKHVMLDEPLRALGNYTVPVKLHRDVTAEVQVWIERP